MSGASRPAPPPAAARPAPLRLDGSRLDGPATRRPRRRRSRWREELSIVLIVAGLVVALDAGLTLVWQEPLTAVVALIRREGVDERFLRLRALLAGEQAAGRLPRLRTPAQEIRFLAGRAGRLTPDGAALGELRISAIGVRFQIVQGVSQSDLQLGPGHYPTTALPGLGRTVAIAGHRTTYLAPFRDLNALRPGETIVLRMPYGTFTYAVQRTVVVDPDAWWITRNVGYERLVLSACAPLYSAAQRIVVFARLVRESPRLPL